MLNLPKPLLCLIISHLDHKSRASVELTCRLLTTCARDQASWINQIWLNHEDGSLQLYAKLAHKMARVHFKSVQIYFSDDNKCVEECMAILRHVRATNLTYWADSSPGAAEPIEVLAALGHPEVVQSLSLVVFSDSPVGFAMDERIKIWRRLSSLRSLNMATPSVSGCLHLLLCVFICVSRIFFVTDLTAVAQTHADLKELQISYIEPARHISIEDFMRLQSLEKLELTRAELTQILQMQDFFKTCTTLRTSALMYALKTKKRSSTCVESLGARPILRHSHFVQTEVAPR